jgi:hypothetical protein
MVRSQANTSAFNGMDSTVNLLLKKGADINAQDENGTPLHLAQQHRKSSIITLVPFAISRKTKES